MAQPTQAPLRIAAVALSVFCFIVACALPALEFARSAQGRTEAMPGIQLLVTGWMGILAGQFAWLANPPGFIALVFLGFGRWVAALVLSGISFLLSLNTLLLFRMSLPADEGGVGKLFLQRFRPGFFLWKISLAVPFVAALVGWLRRRR